MKTIVGLFERYEDADYVVEELQRRSIAKNQISVLAHEGSVRGLLPGEPVDNLGDERVVEINSTADSMGVGSITGAVAGGIGGLLLGMGALAIPGIGPAYAAGSLLSALTATAAGVGIGAVTGGLVGAMMGWGLSEEDAHAYAEGVRRGGTLVAVRVPEEATPEVQSVMRDARVVDIESYREQLRSTGWHRFEETEESRLDMTRR